MAEVHKLVHMVTTKRLIDMKISSSFFFLLWSSFLAVFGQAYQFGAPVPFPVCQHDGRFLVETDSQCIPDSETIFKEIEKQGAVFTVHIDCSDTTFCQGDASQHPMYDNFINVCQSLNGTIYSYDLQCRNTFDIDDGSTLPFTIRWNNMASCLAPVCDANSAIDILSECTFSETQSTGGELVSVVCQIQDLRYHNGTVLAHNINIGDCLESGGNPLASFGIEFLLFVFTWAFMIHQQSL